MLAPAWIMQAELQSQHVKLGQSLPLWYTKGVPITDIYSRAPDIEVLDNWRFDDDPDDWTTLDWRECWVPVESFGLAFDSMESYLTALPNACYIQNELKRIQEIEEWIVSCGSLEAALNQSPAIVRVTPGQPKLEDGYHRLAVVAIKHRQAFLKSACAPW